MTSERCKVMRQIAAERSRQDELWGEQNHPIRHKGDQAFYQYELDSARKNCEAREKNGTLAWIDIAREEYWEAFTENDPAAQRHELVQLGAVIVSMIECIDRNGGKE
jgi:hypothetical protein